MPDSSLSGDTTSAKQPRELVAHSRNGESESDTLFFPPLRGVLPPSATQPLGLCMVLPSMPSTPGMQPEAVRRRRREVARTRTGAGADSHLGSFLTRLDCAHWTGGRCPWHPRSGAAGAFQSCGTRSCRAEAAVACETETRTYCCLAHLPTRSSRISGPAVCNRHTAHTGACARRSTHGKLMRKASTAPSVRGAIAMPRYVHATVLPWARRPLTGLRRRCLPVAAVRMNRFRALLPLLFGRI